MRVFFIEGVIGAGKTTFIKFLAEYLPNVQICLEPVDLWREIGILDKFYKNPAEWAYKFQSFAFCSRIMAIKDNFNPAADIYLIERSPISDKIFASIQNFAPIEQKMFNLWSDTYEALLPFTEYSIIYLKPPIDLCQERIKTRGRAEEQQIPIEYQQLLEKAHDECFKTQKNVIVVDTSQDMRKIADQIFLANVK